MFGTPSRCGSVSASCTPSALARQRRQAPAIKLPYVMPYNKAVRKTSVYLGEAQAERLARLAREEGRPQAEILREAVASYQPRTPQDRNFALAGSGRGDGSSIADVPDEGLLKGFGE